MITLTSAPESLLIPQSSSGREDLEPAPIAATDVLAGSPVARSRHVLDLGDGLTAAVWDCTAGRFRWHYGACDEVVHIVEGEATITDSDGGVVHLRPGVIATFVAGSSVVWEVEEYVKKVAVMRDTPTDPIWRLALRLRLLAKRLLRR